MTSSLTGGFFILFILLLLSALFSSAETSITAMSRSKLLALKEKHPYEAKFLDWLLHDLQKALTITLIANNLVNIAASALATSLALVVFGDKGIFIAVVIMTILIVIFGEILPKSIAIVRSEKVLLLTLPVLTLLYFLLAPFVWFLKKLIKYLGLIFGVDLESPHTFVTREEIEQMVTIGEATGVIEEVERKMIHGIISFKESRVYEIMVPRTDMDAVPSEYSIGEAVAVFQEHGHSRVPIFEGSLDNIIGILYVKDTIPYLDSGMAQEPVSKLKRDPLFIPESMKIVDLFNIMKGKHVHMAIVVDEYGGTAGIVTLEDLLEEIVGEIQDEYDKENPPVLRESAGSFLVQGYVGLEDLSESLNYPFESEDAESIGGLVLSLAGEFPEEGEKLRYRDWEIDVVKVEDHRIQLLRLLRI
ncbi:MAG: HlyC/CorC family transporter [Synergistales bacterium]|nr:HlyC/CorC family transporter [Synergistales bacterium]